ncbi:MAG: hypothetical protein IJQ08_06655 [Synergistaceae bacterium]|nr:hypothetical protein [Synergistaceae bacterium]
MSKIDASRFLAHLQKVFAPKIIDGQEFIAYIDGDSNSFIIQAENVINASTSNSSFDSEAVENLAIQLSALQSQADSLENFCRSIPALQTQISTLSGDTEEGLLDFEWAFIQEAISDMKANISEFSGRLEPLEEKISSIENQFYGLSNDNDTITSSDLNEAIVGLELKIYEMQETIDTLSLELHGQVTSETEYDIS